MFRTIPFEPANIIFAAIVFLLFLVSTTLLLRAILKTFHYNPSFFLILDTRFFLWALTAFVLLLDANPYSLAALLAITTAVYLLAYETVLKLDITIATLTLVFDSIFTALSFAMVAYVLL